MTTSPDILAAAEKIYDGFPSFYYYDRWTNIEAIAAAIAAERERCAKIAEDMQKDTDNQWTWPRNIAEAIRKG